MKRIIAQLFMVITFIPIIIFGLLALTANVIFTELCIRAAKICHWAGYNVTAYGYLDLAKYMRSTDRTVE